MATKTVKVSLDELAQKPNWRINMDVRPDGGHTTTDNSDIELVLLYALLNEMKQINDRLRSIENLARCPNVQRGFISMNKVRLHLEKRWPAPKKRKV